MADARHKPLVRAAIDPERADELATAARVARRGRLACTAFDVDVLIYAASRGHRLGRTVARLFDRAGAGPVGIGSVLLLAEVLSKPLRQAPDSTEVTALVSLLSRLDLRDFDAATARLALALSATYGLRAADAARLATAVAAGADRFLTNNRKDFSKTITEVEVVYPHELAARRR